MILVCFSLFAPGLARYHKLFVKRNSQSGKTKYNQTIGQYYYNGIYLNLNYEELAKFGLTRPSQLLMPH